MGHDSKFHDGLEREKNIRACVCVYIKKNIYVRIIYMKYLLAHAQKNNEKIVFKINNNKIYMHTRNAYLAYMNS